MSSENTDPEVPKTDQENKENFKELVQEEGKETVQEEGKEIVQEDIKEETKEETKEEPKEETKEEVQEEVILPPKTLEEQVGQEQFVNNVMKQIRMFLAFKYCKTDNIPAEVMTGLYIGSIGAAMCKNVLIDLGITHILCVADSISPIFPDDFSYKVIKILDSPEVRITDYLKECFSFINSSLQNGKVLVHCFAGKSRSASVVIGYLMKVNQWSYDEAYSYLKGKRAVIEPNIGFSSQLKEAFFS